MPYDDFDDDPPRFGPGGNRGFPAGAYALGGADDGAFAADDGPGPGPGRWTSDDGYVLALPAPVWGGYPRWRMRRRFPRPALLAGLAPRARRMGTLRGLRSGAAFPVFAAHAGGRRWGLVTRLRRELEAEVHEIVAVRPVEELHRALAASPEPIPDLPAPPARPGMTADGWKLRLPHRGLHSILSRLRPSDLSAMAGGPLPADPAPTVVRSVARMAAQARRRGSLRDRRSGKRMELFETPGYSLLVNPVGEMQGEIVAVRPETDVLERMVGKGPKSSSPQAPIGPAEKVEITINWVGHCGLGENCPGSGNRQRIYVITRVMGSKHKPLMVGMTQENDIKDRMLGYVHCARSLGQNADRFVAHVGEVTVVRGRMRLLDVESLVMRLLNNLHQNVRNVSMASRASVGLRLIEITHTGAVPPFLQIPGFSDKKRLTGATAHTGSGSLWKTVIEPNVVFETPWG